MMLICLIDLLTKVSQEGKTIYEYMQSVKTIVGDLSIIGHELTDGEIVVHALNGLSILDSL